MARGWRPWRATKWRRERSRSHRPLAAFRPGWGRAASRAARAADLRRPWRADRAVGAPAVRQPAAGHGPAPRDAQRGRRPRIARGWRLALRRMAWIGVVRTRLALAVAVSLLGALLGCATV